MSDDGEPPKLRIARETPEELALRFEREQRRVRQRREDDLSASLAPYRVGSVRYLNAVPLTRGLEEQIVYGTPSELADLLRRDALDAALVSVTEVLFTDRYDILDGIAVASLNEVASVYLAHRVPVEELKEIHCDPASLTSVNLLKVLLAERGLHPRFERLKSYEAGKMPEGALLIGDPAIAFSRGPHEHALWDLGGGWYELTRLPFVYAVWAIRRGLDYERLGRQLREARSFGLETLEYIIRERAEFDYEFRKDYLSWNIHYHMGQAERDGLYRFIELLRKHDLGRVHEPRFLP